MRGPEILYSLPFSASSGSDFLTGTEHMPHLLLQLGLTSQGSYYTLASGPADRTLSQEGVPQSKDIEGSQSAGGPSGSKAGPQVSETKEGQAAPAKEAKKPQPQGACGNEMLLIMGGLFVIVYFLMLRPQQKQEKARRAMLAQLGKGDKIVTSAGIHCEIVAVHAEEGSVTVKFGNDAGQRFKIDRAAISRVQGDEPAPEKKG